MSRAQRAAQHGTPLLAPSPIEEATPTSQLLLSAGRPSHDPISTGSSAGAQRRGPPSPTPEQLPAGKRARVDAGAAAAAAEPIRGARSPSLQPFMRRLIASALNLSRSRPAACAPAGGDSRDGAAQLGQAGQAGAPPPACAPPPPPLQSLVPAKELSALPAVPDDGAVAERPQQQQQQLMAVGGQLLTRAYAARPPHGVAATPAVTDAAMAAVAAQRHAEAPTPSPMMHHARPPLPGAVAAVRGMAHTIHHAAAAQAPAQHASDAATGLVVVEATACVIPATPLSDQMLSVPAAVQLVVADAATTDAAAADCSWHQAVDGDDGAVLRGEPCGALLPPPPAAGSNVAAPDATTAAVALLSHRPPAKCGAVRDSDSVAVETAAADAGSDPSGTIAAAREGAAGPADGDMLCTDGRTLRSNTSLLLQQLRQQQLRLEERRPLQPLQQESAMRSSKPQQQHQQQKAQQQESVMCPSKQQQQQQQLDAQQEQQQQQQQQLDEQQQQQQQQQLDEQQQQQQLDEQQQQQQQVEKQELLQQQQLCSHQSLPPAPDLDTQPLLDTQPFLDLPLSVQLPPAAQIATASMCSSAANATPEDAMGTPLPSALVEQQQQEEEEGQQKQQEQKQQEQKQQEQKQQEQKQQEQKQQEQKQQHQEQREHNEQQQQQQEQLLPPAAGRDAKLSLARLPADHNLFSHALRCAESLQGAVVACSFERDVDRSSMPPVVLGSIMQGTHYTPAPSCQEQQPSPLLLLDDPAQQSAAPQPSQQQQQQQQQGQQQQQPSLQHTSLDEALNEPWLQELLDQPLPEAAGETDNDQGIDTPCTASQAAVSGEEPCRRNDATAAGAAATDTGTTNTEEPPLPTAAAAATDTGTTNTEEPPPPIAAAAATDAGTTNTEEPPPPIAAAAAVTAQPPGTPVPQQAAATPGPGPATALRVSQTQSPLLLAPEVASLTFHDPAGHSRVTVCECFPFQRDALAFAAWCNAAGPAPVAALQAAARSINFGSFGERLAFLQRHMQVPLAAAAAAEGVPAAQEASAAADATRAAASDAHLLGGHEQQQQQQQPAAAIEVEVEASQPLPDRTTLLMTPEVRTALAEAEASAAAAAAAVGVAGGAAVRAVGAITITSTAAAVAAAEAASRRAALPAAPDATAAAGTAAGSGPPGAAQSAERNRSTAGPLPWVHVFTEEYQGRHGYTRRFLAASYEALWLRHSTAAPLQRHLYEVIVSGRPCHAYFDLEFSPCANPTADGPALVKLLVGLLGQVFWEMWRIKLKKQYVLELDSSTADKFSRHLLLRVPGYAFRDNAQVGALARLLTCRAEALQHFYLAKAKAQPGAGAATSGDGVSTAADTADMPPEQQQTTRQPAARSCFVDGAVYSRNRHFRLLGSCKGGKRAVLEPTLRWSMSAASHNELPVTPVQLFLMGLICNVHPDAQLLEFAPPQQQPLPTVGGVPLGAAQHQQQQQQQRYGSDEEEELLPWPPTRPGDGALSGFRTIKATWGFEAAAQRHHYCQQQQQQDQQQQQHTGLDVPHWMGNQQERCIDPAVLRDVVLAAVGFVEDIASRRAGGAPVQVRTIAFCGGRGTPGRRCCTYAFSLLGPGSHACGNVGRAHRHNHVFYVLDFAGGVFSQKCHDPDCWGYRSPWSPLPEGVWQRERLMAGGSSNSSNSVLQPAGAGHKFKQVKRL